jgi:UPF0755 protein
VTRAAWIAAGSIAAATLALAVALAVWLWTALGSPARTQAGNEIVFEVVAGESLPEVARRLEATGLLPERALFGPAVLVGWARLRGLDRAIKSGEYDLDPGLSPLEILEKLAEGRVKTYAVTLPEGLRLDEIAVRLEASGIARAADFLARARSPELAQSLGIQGSNVEGYLYPETYRFERNSPPDEIIRRMYAELETRLLDADREALARSGLTLHEVVTLASIVEKETSVPLERPLVAAVFRNRLALAMPLQTDPTVIYGILQANGGFDGNLRRADLEADTPYNTYTRRGLPPGPIANPSIESIRAVLEPARVPYLYFVSRNDGTHAFSTTLGDHAAAVRRYQQAKSQ